MSLHYRIEEELEQKEKAFKKRITHNSRAFYAKSTI